MYRRSVLMSLMSRTSGRSEQGFLFLSFSRERLLPGFGAVRQ